MCGMGLFDAKTRNALTEIESRENAVPRHIQCNSSIVPVRIMEA